MSHVAAGDRLWRALERSAAAAGCPVTMIYSVSESWSSAMFLGGRHEMMLAADVSPAFAPWADDLKDAELSVPGHLVADVAVGRVEQLGGRQRVTIEALTVEDA
ncbi:hypothetical protein M9978_02430 [Sphingomonas sp. MG17]|uniref:Uncharacterized protein n=1 Tax=Sphingomonas tagetis TaxID=2949092 RepID=A0A9X2HL69_9SPHN|nr:hypothetical protein [Sphingomonas tagetis]MCP3729273.1 hypothetical protein [Sphingomonas tagetis]